MYLSSFKRIGYPIINLLKRTIRTFGLDFDTQHSAPLTADLFQYRASRHLTAKHNSYLLSANMKELGYCDRLLENLWRKPLEERDQFPNQVARPMWHMTNFDRSSFKNHYSSVRSVFDLGSKRKVGDILAKARSCPQHDHIIACLEYLALFRPFCPGGDEIEAPILLAFDPKFVKEDVTH